MHGRKRQGITWDMWMQRTLNVLFRRFKPSDMLPELQGRLPITVELKGLTEEDLYRILTEPVANLVRQQVEMIATEGVTLKFEDEAICEMARLRCVAAIVGFFLWKTR